MGITPGFVCVSLRAQSWDWTGAISFLLVDQNFPPFDPGGLCCEMASSVRHSPGAGRCAACLT